MPIDDPICIMTTGGMQCMSSPLKTHYPGDKPCVETKPLLTQDQDIAAIANFLGSRQFARSLGKVTRERANLIARVTYLMLVSDVLQPRMPFVISRSRGPTMANLRPARRRRAIKAALR